MFEKTFESSKLTAPASPDYLRQCGYVKTWDANLVLSAQRYYRHFKDGTAINYGQRSGSYHMMGRVGGTIAYVNGTGYIISAAEVNGLPLDWEILSPLLDYSHRPSYGAFVDEIRGVYVRAYGTKIEFYNLQSLALLKSLTHGMTGSVEYLGWVSAGVLCAISPSSGMVSFIDYLNDMSITSRGRIDACKVAAYDCKCNVITGIGTDGKTRVYVMSAWPSVLGAPVFTPTTVRGKQANLVKVRLTGQDGEPCPDWWVHWTLVAVGSPLPYGWLDKDVSKTDEDGYAWNTYFGPLDGETGQAQIQCSVVLY